MPFVFYVFDTEACKPYTKAAMPPNTGAVSGCDVAAFDITAVEERAQVQAAP